MRCRTAAEAAKRLTKLERRRDRNLYREPPPERVAPPVSLAPVDFLAGGLTDTDVGLRDDPVAQTKAESFLRAVHAFTERQAADRRAAQLLVVETVEGRLSSDDALILAELERLAGQPVPTWMQEKRSAA